MFSASDTDELLSRPFESAGCGNSSPGSPDAADFPVLFRFSYAGGYVPTFSMEVSVLFGVSLLGQLSVSAHAEAIVSAGSTRRCLTFIASLV